MARSGGRTFTTAQLQQLWHEALQAEPSRFTIPDIRNQSRYVHCTCPLFNRDGTPVSSEQQSHNLKILLESLMDAAGQPLDHFNMIDAKFSTILLVRSQSAWARGDAPHPVDKAVQVLERLPPVPPELTLSYPVWHKASSNAPNLSGYFNDPVPFRDRTESFEPSVSVKRLWPELQVVTKSSIVTLRLALLLASCPEAGYDVATCIRRLLDLISELLDMVSAPPPSEGDWNLDYALRKDIVKMYLWANWTRCSLLLFWYILGTQLTFGYDGDWEQLLALRRSTILMDPEIRATLYGWKNERAPYMCSWAFELLKSDRAAPSLDFRHFHNRYADLYSHRSQRCQWASDEPCDGGHPMSCGRFQDKRLVAEEQSVHGPHSATCSKLVWDRKSYVSVRGPVAISTRPGVDTVQYTQATESTMAISHVWSHGHGGRPHTGMNMCLHQRFSRIAKGYDCDSYWIDTLCIPDEHELRKTAISYINRIFAESKVVLVLDRDIMDIDVSQLSIPLQESILATFLVCDWNVRAWTMLEALKGSHSLHLLCRDERTLSLRETLMTLHQCGRLDLTALILAARRLLPSSTEAFRRTSSRKSIESAGSLLSHRHATRAGDDVVIWSLISNTKVFFSAEEMWKGFVGRKIRTAFLMSTSPRLADVPGFSWAPNTPYIRRDFSSPAKFLGPFLVHEGSGSEAALITQGGLQGDWMIYHFTSADNDFYKEAPVTSTSISDNGERKVTVLGGHKIINQCWKTATELASQHLEVALIQPASLAGQVSTGRGESHGELFAICVSEGGVKWRWKEVYSWPQGMKPPPVEKDELLIV